MELFAELPDSARLWLFPLRHPLEPAEASALQSQIEQFVANWQAHKHQLLAMATLLEKQFIAVAVDELKVAASGCSIDALTRAIESIASEAKVEIVRAGEVFYQSDGRFNAIERNGFQRLVTEKAIGANTTVFDNTIGNLRDLRAGLWRKSFSESWHARAFS